MHDTDTIWRPEYSVGVPEIDTQHRYLFQLWQMLDSVRNQRENRQSSRQALLSLLDYIDIHFSTEESYYREHPQFTDHQRIHRAFVDKVRQFEQDLEHDRLDMGAMVDFLHDWLIDHIVNTDIRYFNDLKTIRASSQR